MVEEIYSVVKMKTLFSNQGTILAMFTTPRMDFCVSHFIPFVTLKDDCHHGVYPCEKNTTLETLVLSPWLGYREPPQDPESISCADCVCIDTYIILVNAKQ